MDHPPLPGQVRRSDRKRFKLEGDTRRMAPPNNDPSALAAVYVIAVPPSIASTGHPYVSPAPRRASARSTLNGVSITGGRAGGEGLAGSSIRLVYERWVAG